MKPGDFVYCLEEIDVFEIVDIHEDRALLNSYCECLGWRDISDLTPANHSDLITEIMDEMNTLMKRLKFLTC